MIQLNYSKDYASNITEVLDGRIFSLFYSISLTMTALLGFMGSSLVVLVICTNKELHSPCFKLIAAAGFGSSISALYFIIRGINMLGILAGVFHKHRKAWFCLLPVALFGFWGQPFQCLITCAIACDRMVSMLAPIRYRQLNKNYSIYTIMACGLIVTLQDVAAVAVSPLNRNVVCKELSDAVNTTYRRFFTGILLFYFILTVFFYLIMIVSLRMGKRYHSTGHEITLRHQQMAMMPAIQLMMFSYLFTGILGESLIYTSRFLDNQSVAFPLRGVGTLLRTVGGLVELGALFVRSRKFRTCCLSFLHLKAGLTVTAPPANSSAVIRSANKDGPDRTADMQLACISV